MPKRARGGRTKKRTVHHAERLEDSWDVARDALLEESPERAARVVQNIYMEQGALEPTGPFQRVFRDAPAPVKQRFRKLVPDYPAPYSFDELSPMAKDRAITNYRHSGAAFDQDDTEMLAETFRDQLKEKGLPSDDVRWRLSHSQGDGVAFYGNVDLKEYLRANKLKSQFPALSRVADDIGANIEKTTSHYDHYNTMRVYFEPQIDLTDRQQAELDKLEKLIGEDIKAVSRELEKAGYAEIEYREGDEQIAETLRENDYSFDVDGDTI